MELRVAVELLFEQSELRYIGMISLNQSYKCMCEIFIYLYYVPMKATGISQLQSKGEI